MKNQKKKILCRAMAAVLCLVLAAGAIAPVTAQASSVKALTLKYKGKTVNVFDCPAVLDDWSDLKHAAYEEIEKAFGKPDEVSTETYGTDKITEYTYKSNGFKFQFSQYDSEKDNPDSLRRITVKITSKKAALNGIKVGMTYDKVLKKLGKSYDSSHIAVQNNKKKISLWILQEEPGGVPVEFTFKNGKVSMMYFFCS